MPTISGPVYELLVANFSRPNPSPGFGADPETSRPTKIRSGFIFRHIQKMGLSADLTNATRSPARSVIVSTLNAQMQPFDPNVRPGAIITVISDTFAGDSASVFVGPFELVSGRDFATGGGIAATVGTLATAISNLPGYDGTPASPVITVEGPRGQLGLPFNATYRGGERNFDFTYFATNQDGVLGYPQPGNPEGPPTIIPPASLQGAAP